MNKLLDAARAVVARWDEPNWKDVPATGVFINALREAIKREEAQTVELVAVPQELDDDTLRDMAGSAFEEAMAFGISTDSFERLARTVHKRMLATTQPPQGDAT